MRLASSSGSSYELCGFRPTASLSLPAPYRGGFDTSWSRCNHRAEPELRPVVSHNTLHLRSPGNWPELNMIRLRERALLISSCCLLFEIWLEVCWKLFLPSFYRNGRFKYSCVWWFWNNWINIVYEHYSCWFSYLEVVYGTIVWYASVYFYGSFIGILLLIIFNCENSISTE